ncbi:hypothetical protein EDD11_006570 [Mortierella claussenii]|nr:hypothetical protein EDD11_006570 [Mortierella claussenii]
MLAKAACLVAATTGYVICALPPASSKTVNAKKNDRVMMEDWLTRWSLKMPIVLASIVVLETALYLLLMVRGPVFSNDLAIQQLREIKTWHLVLTALAVGGCWLRKWSFMTLDRFFTLIFPFFTDIPSQYQLTIRSGHKLVQNGPYTFLRHPSYTGAILNFIATHFLLLHQGLFDVLVLLLSSAISSIGGYNSLFSLPRSFLGVDGSVWMTGIYAMMVIKMISNRVYNEERMLKEHFGNEWDVYASQRWRFIPLVY